MKHFLPIFPAESHVIPDESDAMDTKAKMVPFSLC